MKRVFVYFLAFSLLLGLCACGDIESAGNGENATEVIKATDKPGMDYTGVTDFDSSEGVMKLRAERLPLPDGMVYATAQQRMDNRVWVGGLSEDGAVIGYAGLDGKCSNPIRLPETCEYVYAMCGEGNTLLVLAGSMPASYTDATGKSVDNPQPEGRLELLAYEDTELVNEVSLEESYNERSMIFKQMVSSGEDTYIQCQNLIVKLRDGAETARYEIGNTSTFRALCLYEEYLIAAETEFFAVDTQIVLIRLSDLKPESALTIEDFAATGLGVTEAGTLLISSDAGIYALDLTEGLGERVLSWDSLYISGRFRYIEEIPDGYLFYEPYQENITLARWRLITTEPQELTLATDQSFGSIYAIVNAYNASQDDYRVVINVYDAFAEESPLDRLRTEIGAGAGPDLLAFTQNDSFGGMKAENVCADLYEYLDADASGGRERLVQPLVEAMSENGNLYWLPYRFSILTLSGPEALLGDAKLSKEAVEAAIARTNGELTVFLPWITADYLLDWFSTAAIQSYVDWATGTCSFDSEGFISLLEMCRDWSGNASLDATDSNTQSLLTFEVLSGFLRLGVLAKMGYRFVGFPVNEGNGSMFQLGLHMAITAQSKNKDGAWDFLSFAISEQGQKANTGSGFSATQSVFDADITSALVNGIESAGTTYEFSSEDAQKFRDLINGTHLVENSNPIISEMITKEAAAFFAGDRSAENTAKNIQSRVGIYLGERY